MKNLPSELTDQLKAEEYIPALLLSMAIGSHDYLFTTWTQPVLFNSALYLPRGFNLQGVSSSAAHVVDSVNIDFDDTDKALFAGFSGLFAGNYPVSIYMVVLDTLGKVITDAAMVLFRGSVDQWTYTPGKLELTVASVFAQWARETTNRFSASCRWKEYNGSECRPGVLDPLEEPTCDRTYVQCDQYDNTAHFGGFRFLPGMVNKRIEVGK
ncbi:MAG: DUF2163 domain-containing protein [Candidatus Peribacteraceae bacterium]|nr:DUF2163 domain-containing protein [Candidatus Peribacteraceae bacterium]